MMPVTLENSEMLNTPRHPKFAAPTAVMIFSWSSVARLACYFNKRFLKSQYGEN
jgi:hypothetical protein